jgi:FKBP-type peptidyl-prolyl cis-trans isomerase
MKLIGYICLVAALLWACEAPRKKNGEDVLPSGIKFQIISRDAKGQKVKSGEYLVMHFVSKVGNDVLDDTYKLGEPQTIMVKPETGLPSEVLPFLQVGDSVKITLSIDSLIKKTGNPNFAQLKEKGNTMEYAIKVFGVKTKEQVQAEALEKEKKAQEQAKINQEQEEGKLEEYIKKTGLTYNKLASGLRFTITQAKPDALKAKQGDSVLVHYTGKLIDGSVFDSSVSRGEPFQFVLGMGAVIRGWDEGIAQLRKGEKATLVIPSSMGYGAQGAGMGKIPPFATLVFDVELVDIKSAPEAKK